MTLLLRIFLSFWLAMLLLAGAIFGLQRLYGGELLGQAEAVLQAKSDAAAVLWLEGGRRAVGRWLREADDNRRLVLVDEAGNPQLRFPVPPGLRRHLPRTISPGVEPLERGRVLLAAPLPGVDPGLFLVTDLHPGRLGRMPLWLGALVAAVVFGLVSLGLAHLLTRRVRPLRRATQRLAGGDLDVRVDDDGSDEIAALGADFNRMAERVQDLLQSQRRLVRDVSHELRSPLARLRIALELAERADNPRPTLRRIAKEADELERLTTEVLTLARLESGQAGLTRQPLQLDELLTRIVMDANFEAGARGRRVRLAAQPLSVIGDAVSLHSAIDNVVRNAVRHTAEQSTVSVSLDREGATAVIRVRDAGPGVPQPQLDSIFEPFARSADSRDRDSGGFGLGLAIARRAIRLHGGDAEARNHPDGGFEVTIRLPCDPP
jgi:two-component system sensor histidine kinase CpxA